MAGVAVESSVTLPFWSAGAEPNIVPSMRNVTLPWGTAETEDASAATRMPGPAEESATETDVNVLINWPDTAWTLTVCGCDVLPAQVALALYTAVNACWPVASDAELKVACPPSSDDVPSCVVPSKNVTPPNGVSTAEVTVAVSVRTVPEVGLAEDAESVVTDGMSLTVTVTGAEELVKRISGL